MSDHASNGWSYGGWVLSWCAVMRFRLGGSASVSLKEGICFVVRGVYIRYRSFFQLPFRWG